RQSSCLFNSGNLSARRAANGCFRNDEGDPLESPSLSCYAARDLACTPPGEGNRIREPAAARDWHERRVDVERGHRQRFSSSSGRRRIDETATQRKLVRENQRKNARDDFCVLSVERC